MYPHTNQMISRKPLHGKASVKTEDGRWIGIKESLMRIFELVCVTKKQVKIRTEFTTSAA